MNNINVKELYILKRRRKRILLKQLAEFIGCSMSLISRYENNNCDMDAQKIKKYREFIDQFQ